MSDQPSPPAGERSAAEEVRELINNMRPAWPPMGPWQWVPPERVVDDQGVALDLDATLRVREQAIHSAAMLFDTGAQFPEDDAEKVVAVAKRFECYIRSGS